MIINLGLSTSCRRMASKYYKNFKRMYKIPNVFNYWVIDIAFRTQQGCSSILLVLQPRPKSNYQTIHLFIYNIPQILSVLSKQKLHCFLRSEVQCLIIVSHCPILSYLSIIYHQLYVVPLQLTTALSCPTYLLSIINYMQYFEIIY